MILLLVLALFLAVFSVSPWGSSFPALAMSVILTILYLLIPVARL